MSTSQKYAIKALREFEPIYYRQWASQVKNAFAEREWDDYLVTPPPELPTPSSSTSQDAGGELEPIPFKPDSHINALAKAFLSQSIPYRYQPAIEDCASAAEIWAIFIERYGTRSREEELRYESELLSLVKLSTETIDTFIEKFDNLLSSIRAQQDLANRWDETKVNMYFLRCLELSKIPNEPWQNFVTYLGSTYASMTNNQLQAKCRIYYTTYMVPHLKPTPQEQVYTASTGTTNQNASNTGGSSSQQTNNSLGRGRGRGNDRGFSRGGTRGDNSGNRVRGNNNNAPRSLPRDPNAWCTRCERSGHASHYCYRRYKESESISSFSDWCANQQNTTASPPQYSQAASGTNANAPPAPSSNRPSGPMQHKDQQHGHSYTVRSCRCHTSSTGEWIYDTACTEHMTSNPLYFTTYDAFDTPVEVHGINGLLQGLGHGDVVIEDHYGNTHTLRDVWYVPGLNDSIVSKHWTKHSGLRTTMDQHENFQFYSTEPNNPFHMSTTTIDKMSIISNIKVLEYDSKAPAANTYNVTVTIPPAMVHATTSVSSQLMHLRLCHASTERMRLLGITGFKSGKCHPCIMGKQTRKPFPPNTNPRATRRLERVFSDICPVTPESFGHGLYFITFVDEATRYVWIYILPNKTSSTVLQVLRSWLALVQNQAQPHRLQILRTDEGGEYQGETLKTVSTFLDEHGITHEPTSAYSSASNGVAERMNRTLMDMVRSMLLTSGLPAPFWGEAVHTAVKVRNRLPTSSLENDISPHQAWFGVPPKLDHLRVFGCVAFAKIIHPITKVASRSEKCCFLGYEGTTQYRLFDPTTNKVRTRLRNVTFIEDEFLDRTAFLRVPYADRPLQVPEPRNYTELDEELDEDDLAELFPEIDPEMPVPTIPMLPYMPATPAPRSPPKSWAIPPPNLTTSGQHESESDIPSLYTTPIASPISPASQHAHRPASQTSPPHSEHSSPHESPHESPQATDIRPPAPPVPIRRSGRATKNTWQKNEGIESKSLVANTGPSLHSSSPYYTASYAPPNEPRNLREAMDSPYSHYWTGAIEAELQSLTDHGTYTIVLRPRNRKVIGSKFAFKIKNPETDNPRFKARFVAKGYTQVPDIDYGDTFAPVAKSTSVRLVLALAAGRRLLVNHYDVETAFLNSIIDREIYIEQPEGFEHPDFPREDYVLLINKGLYGLKQAGSLYNEDQKAKLIQLGFTPSEADECVFISADERIIVSTYVDDGLICAETQEEIDWVITELSKHYKLRNLGFPDKFLGMDISRDGDRGPITVSQSTYARKLLAKYGMENCNPVKAPCDQKAAYLHLRTEAEAPADAALYRSMTSSIMHLAIWTRPDIAWITNKLCQFNQNPSELHMTAVTHLFRYIQGSLDYAIIYSPSNDNSLYGLFTDYNDFDYTPLHGYSDASGASDPDDRCSTSGYIFFLYNGPIVWGSRKQTYAVALSSMEGEYLALTEAAKEAMFLRNLLASIYMQ